MKPQRIATALALLLAFAACHQDYHLTPQASSPSPTGTGGSGPIGTALQVMQTITAGVAPTSVVDGLTTGPDGRVWFTQPNTAQIGAASAAGAVSEYTIPAPSSSCVQPEQIVVGPDGNLWASSYCGQVVRITPSGSVTVFAVVATASLVGIVVGPDGNLWTADVSGSRLFAISTSGSIVRTVAMPAVSSPTSIAVGSDKNLWVTDSAHNLIDRVTTAGAITTYGTNLTTGGAVSGIVAAPDGNLYFTEPAAASGGIDRVGRITTAGVATELGALSTGATPADMLVGSDGNVWFRENGAGSNAVGSITIATGSISEYSLNGILAPNAPDDGAGDGSDGLAVGATGTLWLGGLASLFVTTL